MANYELLSDIFGTIENATVIRNNSKNDDGVDTISGVNWFSYNGVVCSNIYASGNMFIGLGANSEHLKVNRRDGASYYVWREEGTLFNFYKFLRIRWQGYSRYNYSSASYLQTFDVILWDTGDISLHMVNIPTSNFDGAFTLGSLSYTKPTTASPDVTFKLQEDGSYLVEYSLIDLKRKKYLSNGSAEFEINLATLPPVTKYLTSFLNVKFEQPENTDFKIYTKLDDGSYFENQNDSEISCLTLEDDLSNSKLFIKFEMSTNDDLVSPKIKEVNLIIRDYSDENIVLLTLPSGNINSFQNAVGDVTVSYDGSGTLMGLGGPVAAFEVSFEPKDLIPKNNFNNIEHVTLSGLSISANLIETIRTNTKMQNEHVTLSGLEITATLIHVDNI